MSIDSSNLSFDLSMEDGGGRADDDRVYNVLVIGDFGGKRNGAPLSFTPIEIDRDSFGEVMRRLVPRASIDLPDGPFEIGFGDLESFHPDALFGQVRLFDELRDLRRGLRSNSEYELAARRVRSWVAPRNVAETETAPTEAVNLLDEILHRDDGFARRDSLDAFVSEVLEPHLVRVDDDERATLVNAVDRACEALMRTILHSADFRKCEAAWRGLYLLVRRFETDARHRVFFIDATKEELAADLKKSELADSAFLAAASSIDGLGLIAGCYEFGIDVDDIAALIRLSRIGGAVNAPFVSHLTGGVTETAETELKLWNALRESDFAEFIGLVPNRILGRTVYGAETEPIDGFGFEEFTGVPDAGLLCWLNPAFAVALLLLRTETEGYIINQINKLPCFSYNLDGDVVSVNCAEFDVNERELGVLLERGLMPLVGFRNEDRIVVPRFQSVSVRGVPLGGRH